MAPMTQGRPRPRKTLTELLPVMLPMEASAQGSCCAAVIEAKVSGREVPSATSVMAVTWSGMLSTHPSSPAMSPTIAVTMPIISSEIAKQGQPPPYSAGGTKANSSFHGNDTTCMAQSSTEGASAPPSSFDSCSPPFTCSAARNCSAQLAWEIFSWPQEASRLVMVRSMRSFVVSSGWMQTDNTQPVPAASASSAASSRTPRPAPPVASESKTWKVSVRW
mmetsp:Transcript_16483/g.51815  ORF Transcript_16483/g.51815 Transcript_16483/m.51815 type:complete len:220 (-) Transcript_16483:657-1316(-)